MNLGKNKIVMVMLLLVFVSQVTAANTVICLMDNQSKVTIEDHSNHNMMAEQKDGHHSSQAQQLCSQDNNCSMTGCLAFILPYISIKQAHALSSQDIVIHPVKSAPSQLLTSLYRPPILS